MGRTDHQSCMYKRRDANNRAQITRNHRARGHQPSEAAKPRWILASRIFCPPRTIPSISALLCTASLWRVNATAAFIASIPLCPWNFPPSLPHKSTVDYFRPSMLPVFPFSLSLSLSLLSAFTLNRLRDRWRVIHTYPISGPCFLTLLVAFDGIGPRMRSRKSRVKKYSFEHAGGGGV